MESHFLSNWNLYKAGDHKSVGRGIPIMVTKKECYLFVVGSTLFRARRGKQGYNSVLPVSSV